MPAPDHPQNQSPAHDQLTAFYTREAAPLQRRVAQDVIASDALIEDACSYAWCQLIRHRERIDLDSRAFWWLHRVAVRRAWRLAEHDRRESAIGDCADLQAAMPRDSDPAIAIERREELRTVDRLSNRQRRLLLAQAAGYTAAEISRTTGDSPATIARQIRRARRQLRVVT